MQPALSTFYATSPPPATLPARRTAMDIFVAGARARGLRVALVTSGGTAVPLERRCVRFIDNFSTGARGACLAERLLASGRYAVLYLHRAGARRPLLHAALDGFLGESEAPPVAGEGCGATESGAGESATAASGAAESDHAAGSDASTLAALAAARAAWRGAVRGGLLLEQPFVTLSDYLHSLREAACALAPAGGAALVLLAAAVSDWHLPPGGGLAEHKLQSNGGDGEGLALALAPVPKALAALTSAWCPRAVVASFKLETDALLLLPKAAAALRGAGVTAVVANLLTRRYAEVLVVEEAEAVLSPSPRQDRAAEEAEAGVPRHSPRQDQPGAGGRQGGGGGDADPPPLRLDGGGHWQPLSGPRVGEPQPPVCAPQGARLTRWAWSALPAAADQRTLAVTAIHTAAPPPAAGGAPQPQLEDALAGAIIDLHDRRLQLAATAPSQV